MIQPGSGVEIRKKTRDLFAKAILFVMARRKESGGFGATPRLPATVTDTYHGLRILNLARQYGAMDNCGYDPLGDESLRAYLSACLLKFPGGARTRFQIFWCCLAAGVDVDRRAAEDVVAAQLCRSASLEDGYYHARLLREVLERPLPEAREILNNSTVMIGKWHTVDEAWMNIYLSRQIRSPLPHMEEELITWFQDSQNMDGGFGFFPGTTSFVENCHASLRALAFLEAKPRDQAGAFRFLVGCQTAAGGFGRSSRAAPFLYATWHALAALAILDE